MEKISNQGLSILDALLNSPVDLSCLFLEKTNYTMLFNVPWHGLEASLCCREISILLDHKLVEIVDSSSEQIYVTLGLTKVGGHRWSKNFLINGDMFIGQGVTFSDDGKVSVVFSCPSEQHLKRLRDSIAELKDMFDVEIRGVVASNSWKDWIWFSGNSAFEFSLVSKDSEWLESPQYMAISQLANSLSIGWRKSNHSDQN